jgi:hypothetical protein
MTKLDLSDVMAPLELAYENCIAHLETAATVYREAASMFSRIGNRDAAIRSRTAACALEMEAGMLREKFLGRL